MLIYRESLDRADVRHHPNCLYLYGDTLDPNRLQPHPLQAETNAVGIPVLRRTMGEADAEFSDADLNHVGRIIAQRFMRAAEHLEQGGDVVIPAHGFGAAYSRLHMTAPRLYALIERWVTLLCMVSESRRAETQSGVLSLVRKTNAGLLLGA